jgi:hypothetical protein
VCCGRVTSPKWRISVTTLKVCSSYGYRVFEMTKECTIASENGKRDYELSLKAMHAQAHSGISIF